MDLESDGHENPRRVRVLDCVVTRVVADTCHHHLGCFVPYTTGYVLNSVRDPVRFKLLYVPNRPGCHRLLHLRQPEPLSLMDQSRLVVQQS